MGKPLRMNGAVPGAVRRRAGGACWKWLHSAHLLRCALAILGQGLDNV